MMKQKLRRILSMVLAMAMVLNFVVVGGAPKAEAYSPAEHKTLSRQASADGQVLLENRNGALPIAEGATVALFGRAQIDYVRGGGGSGNTNVEYTRNILQGMQMKETDGKIKLVPELTAFYTEQVTTNGITDDASITITDDVWNAAKAATETAVVVIGRYSAEGSDRSASKGDYYLSDAEYDLITRVANEFDKTIVVLNIGAVMDTSWIKGGTMNEPVANLDAVLVGWQGGMEGGLATADVLVGDVNPSGKTVDTWAKDYTDYPSSSTFKESTSFVNYTEDIFVGYRYFETIPGAAAKVNYEFGYGLSYTTFTTEIVSVDDAGDEIVVEAKVTNTGSVAGKQVVQVYFSAPRGDLDKPAKELAAFDKTSLLEPGESETLTLSFPITDMSSYDDTGVIQKSAYVMEAGDYRFFVGNSVRDGEYAEYVYTVSDDLIAEELSELCPPENLPKRMKEDGTYVDVNVITEEDLTHTVAADGQTRIEMEEFIDGTDTLRIERFYDENFESMKCLAYMQKAGQFAEYALDVEKEGRYKLDLRYALGYADKSNCLAFTVDGEHQTGATFNAKQTGDGDGKSEWYNFIMSEDEMYVNLKQGKNRLRITANVASQPNFDYMILEYAGEYDDSYERRVSATGITKIEAESFDESVVGIANSEGKTNPVRIESFTYADGTAAQCVAYMNYRGNGVKYYIYVEQAGQYNLQINGANGRAAFAFTPMIKVEPDNGAEELFIQTITAERTCGGGETVEGLPSGWYGFADLEAITINLPKGNCVLSINSMEPDKFVNMDYITLEKVGPYQDRGLTVNAAGQTVIQAEDFVSAGWSESGYPPVLEIAPSSAGAFAGTVCTAHVNHLGNYLTWWLDVEEAGTYHVTLKYANCHAAHTFEPEVTLNGEEVDISLAVDKTSVEGNQYYNFKDAETFTLYLEEGRNVFTMACAVENQFPNLDTLTFVNADEPAPAMMRSLAPTSASGKLMLLDVYEGGTDSNGDYELMDEFIAQLTVEELAQLLSAQGNRDGGNTQGWGNNSSYGIPLVMTADGPQGIRISAKCTAWPISTNLSCTWDEELVGEVGTAAATEAHYHNMDIWLAPGMNIHRDPLCGRNFEYYSEDPLLTGKLAASITRAVQAEGVAISLKHFAANNKEQNRSSSDSRMTERALREIYLRGFEIAVKEADPWTIMSSYNFINGIETAENRDLLTGILRTEWGYNGVLETDWGNNSNHVYEVLAGNDVKMTNSQPDKLVAAVESGKLTREHLETGATRVLELIMKVNYFQDKFVNVPVVEIDTVTNFKVAENIIWSGTVQTEATGDTDGGNNLGYCDAGAYAEYQIDVLEAGSYTLSARVASKSGTGAFDVLVDGEKIASFDAPNTGAYQTWVTIETVEKEMVNLTAGRHTLRLNWTESGSNLNWILFDMKTTDEKMAEAIAAAEAAQAAAEAAKADAEAAQAAAEAAQAAAEAAATSTAADKAAAEAAKTAAETALAEAQVAKKAAEDAQSAAEKAAQAAEEGKVAAAEEAEAAAESAAESAESAKNAAESASTAAEAAEKAQNAQKAAEDAQKAAEEAQKAAEDAAASAAEDKSAAENAKLAAQQAQQMAEQAKTAAEEAKEAAEESNVEAAKEAENAAKSAASAADASATAAQAALNAQAAQKAAEDAQAAAEAAAETSAENMDAAEAAQKAAEAAQAQAETAKAAAETAKEAADAAAEAAYENNVAAAEKAALSAASAAESANSAKAAADSAKTAAEAAKAAQEAQKAAEDAAAKTESDKEAVEDAKDKVEQTAAEVALALAKYNALVELNEYTDKLKNNATTVTMEALAKAAQEARDAVNAAEDETAIANALEEGKANMDSAVCMAKDFTDVKLDAWYHDAVDYVLQKGYMNGNGNGTFTPNGVLSRAMMVQILYNIEGRPAVSSSKSFDDVAQGSWYYNAVMWAAEEGIVNGYSNGCFGANDKITREQMVTIMWRYAGEPECTAQQIVFADSALISKWAADAVMWAYEAGVVKGVGNNMFDPAGSSTRAAAAQIMMNYFK